MTYASLDDIRAASHIADSIDDRSLQGSLDAACAQIDGYCGRTFTLTASAARLFAAADNWTLRIDDAATIIKVESSTNLDGVFDVTWATTDYQLEPLNGRRNGKAVPYDGLRAVGSRWFPSWAGVAAVRVTGTWGWASVPADVRQAAILQTLRLWKRLDTPLGLAGGPETGLIRVARSIDGDVAQLLSDYRTGDNVLGGLA